MYSDFDDCQFHEDEVSQDFSSFNYDQDQEWPVEDPNYDSNYDCQDQHYPQDPSEFPEFHQCEDFTSDELNFYGSDLDYEQNDDDHENVSVFGEYDRQNLNYFEDYWCARYEQEDAQEDDDQDRHQDAAHISAISMHQWQEDQRAFMMFQFSFCRDLFNESLHLQEDLPQDHRHQDHRQNQPAPSRSSTTSGGCLLLPRPSPSPRPRQSLRSRSRGDAAHRQDRHEAPIHRHVRDGEAQPRTRRLAESHVSRHNSARGLH